MIALAFIVATAMQGGPGLDSVAVYSAILAQVRSEFPRREIVLAETRSDVACMPHCGARLRDADGSPNEPPGEFSRTDHSPALLATLRERGLVQATCVVPEMTFGCPAYPRHMFVALGEISATPSAGPAPVDGGVWVRMAFLVPPSGGMEGRDSAFPNAFGYWYLLRQQDDGAWVVVRRAPGFVV